MFSNNNKKSCKRSDGKIFHYLVNFQKKCNPKNIRGFTMRASCAPYKYCFKGGKLLPKLRKLSKENKKHIYKLYDPQRKRILAIEEGINQKKKQKNKRFMLLK